jgi:glycine/D-amino acid oxidase-like deaminating enzyme
LKYKNDIASEFGFDAPSAILSNCAAQTDAYSLTHALHQYGIKGGLSVYERTCIAYIKHEKNAVELKTDDGYNIHARKLIYATGYEAVNYIDKKIVSLHTTYATASESFTEKSSLWKDDVLIWNTADPYLYMRTTKDKRIITGGRDEHFITAAKRDGLISKKTNQLKKDFQSLFPAIDYKPEFSWAGVFGKTKDGLPYIGSYNKTPNGFFALGFGGNGITFSVIAAKIIADIITNGESENESLFSFDR